MRQFPELKFNIDYKYICGRDNYTCQNSQCQRSLGETDIYFQTVDPSLLPGGLVGSETNLVMTCRKCAIDENVQYETPLKAFSGRLIVITGPMFSQKSTTTRALFNKYKAFFKDQDPAPYIWVKPQIDNRKVGYTKTHDQDLIEAYTIDAQRPDLALEQLSPYTIVAIDEAQFFSERILYVVHELLKKGCLVIVNGLKLTASRGLFGVMHYLMAEADEIISLKSVCNACQLVDYATRTKTFSGNLTSIKIGGMGQYYAVCPTCDGGLSEKEFLKKSLQEEEI